MNTPDIQYVLLTNPNGTEQVCFNRNISHSEAVWVENSVESTLPAFVLQFAVILAVNRLFLILSELFHVPRIVANIFTGVLFGPSALGNWNYFFKNIFPYYNMLPFETMGAVTLVYYAFLIGLEVDLKPMERCYNKKAMVVAIVGIIFTLPIGAGLYHILVSDMGRKTLSPSDKNRHIRGAIFWGITLSCSSEFPEIAKILSDLKLLLTENGQLALTSSLISGMFSWTILLLVLTQFCYASVLSFIIVILLVLACFYVIHPFAKWVIKTVGTGDREFLESQVVFLLHAVLVIGLISDGLGVYSITGAFFLGVVIPKGTLNNTVQDKVFDFVSVFMMPHFFVMIGFRTKIHEWALDTHWMTIVIVVALAFMVKMVCIYGVSWVYQMPPKEGLSLALLMNTKGTMPLIILYTARDRLELDSQTFGVMLLACWLMTAISGPLLATLTKSHTASKVVGSQRKSMQGTRPDSPLRVLACAHSKRDADAILDLLKASCPSVRIPIQVLAVELIKMTNRPAASSLIIRDARKPSFSSHSSKVDSFKKGNGDNLSSFDNLSQAIFAEKLRVISNYNSMHKDILNLSTRRHVNLIVTTFQKQPTYDGLGAGTATARAVNIINRDCANRDEKKVVLENLVKEARCCLAIFVDRGFSQKHSKDKKITIAMIYVGGADDREALSYAWRMSRNMDVQLTVVRLVWDNPDDEFDRTDKQYLRGFVQQTMDKPTVRYLEKVVKDEKETVSLLNKIGSKGFDLYVVGRGQGRKMALAQTVDPVLEEPALGPLGDALTDLNSAAETSILIFQREAASHVDDHDQQHVHGGGLGKHDERSASASVQLDGMVEQQLMFPSSTGYPSMMFGHYA